VSRGKTSKEKKRRSIQKWTNIPFGLYCEIFINKHQW